MRRSITQLLNFIVGVLISILLICLIDFSCFSLAYAQVVENYDHYDPPQRDFMICANRYDDIDAQIAACTRMIERGGLYLSDGYFLRARAYSAKANDAAALSDLNEALRLGDTRASDARIETHMYRGDFDKAIGDLTEKIRRGPGPGSDYARRATAYEYKGDHARADIDWTEAIKRDSGYGHFSRGSGYTMRGDYDRALAEFEEAFRIWSETEQHPHESIYMSRGIAYRDKGDLDNALRDMSMKIQQNLGGYGPAPADLVRRGGVYELKNDRERAIADYKAALALPPRYLGGAEAHSIARERLQALISPVPQVSQSTTASPSKSAPQPTEHGAPVAVGTYEDAFTAIGRREYAIALRIYYPLANRGESKAQYNLGLLYSRGYGVPRDYIRSYMWFSLSAARGDPEALKVRDDETKNLTPAQIAEAQVLVREWKPNTQWPIVSSTDRQNAIQTAAANGDAELLRALIEEGADADGKGEGGWTPLSYAVAAGNTENVATLLSASAKSYADDLANSPIVIAAVVGNTDVMNLILGAGFIPEQRSVFYRNFNKALSVAATLGNEPMLKEMVTNYVKWSTSGSNLRLVSALKRKLANFPWIPKMSENLWDISFVLVALYVCPAGYDKGNCLARQ